MRRFLLILALAASCQCGDEMSNNQTGDVGETLDLQPDARSDASNDSADVGIFCGGEDPEPVEVAGWTIAVSYGDGSWTATAPGASSPVLRGPAVCDGEMAIALLDEPPDARHAFGNFEIDLQGDNEWTPNNPIPPDVTPTADGAEIVYRVGDGAAKLFFSEGASGGLRMELVHGVQTAQFRLRCDADEAFFGLGTQVTSMNLRGRTYPLWTEEQGNGKPENGGSFPFNNPPEAAYAPMGVLHSTAGWSGVVTHDGYTEVDLCHSDERFIAVRSHQAFPGFVFSTGTPRERMTAVTEYVGRVRDDVPDWVFGLWVDSVTGPVRLTAVIDALRDNDIPASAIWSEDWIGGETSMFGFRLSYDWVWDEEAYPALPTLVDDLHTRGFAFLAYFNTFIPEPTSTWPIAQAEGYFVEDENGEPIIFTDVAFRNAGLVDLFNPDAVEWLRGYQLTAVTDIGIDGWMADFSEWYPLEAPDAWENHNVYPLQYQRVNDAHLREARPDGNYVFFPRSGWASVNGGSGGVTPVMWGGDQNTEWEYDDGFPTIIPIGAHVGLSGVPIFGSDIAGYNSIGNIENTSKELWFRWSATAAFHPLMRTHHGGDECNNWNFDRDLETIDHLRRYSSIHSMLFWEFQRLYAEAHTLGWPISRHPWLVEPDNAALWTGDQYAWFLGDDIWIAPVLTEGATTREVVLPDRGWWPLFGGAPVDATSETADAPVTELPVYVRPGRALVLTAEPAESFYGATDGETTNLADVQSRFRVALYPDSAGSASSGPGLPLTVSATGLTAFNAVTASLNGNPLPACTDPISTSCTDGIVVWLVDVTTATLEAGGTIDVSADTSMTAVIGVGGAAWGDSSTPTSYAPNPDAPSWCPDDDG